MIDMHADTWSSKTWATIHMVWIQPLCFCKQTTNLRWQWLLRGCQVIARTSSLRFSLPPHLEGTLSMRLQRPLCFHNIGALQRNRLDLNRRSQNFNGYSLMQCNTKVTSWAWFENKIYCFLIIPFEDRTTDFMRHDSARSETLHSKIIDESIVL